MSFALLGVRGPSAPEKVKVLRIMTERAVKQNPEEAEQLFQRGVGAARGGQRRVAASLLARAVQLDSRHEQAWLWLSGVLDDPPEIAFCLRAVLSINPGNQRAQKGLEWLEQRQMIAHQPTPVGIASPAPTAPESERSQKQRHEREGWWVNWRRNRREMSRAWQVVLVGLIVLLSLTLGLNLWLRETITLAKAPPAQPMIVAVVPEATALPTVVPVLQTRLAAGSDAQTLAYLSVIESQRGGLRTAIDSYRETTSKLGNSAVLHAAAARDLRATVDTAYAALVELAPPPHLRAAHDNYLKGLDDERAAMDDMLEFYGSYRIQIANRAVLRLEEARERITLARAAFAATGQTANSSGPPVQTAR